MSSCRTGLGTMPVLGGQHQPAQGSSVERGTAHVAGGPHRGSQAGLCSPQTEVVRPTQWLVYVIFI